MLSSLSRSVEGHVVLITGAGSGIGRATAHLFADHGSYVAVTDIDLQRVESVVEEINQSGGKARGWELDVTDGPKSIKKRTSQPNEGHILKSGFSRKDILL